MTKIAAPRTKVSIRCRPREPRGPSRALTLDQAEAAESSRLHAHVELSVLRGVRIEEARALRWDHVVVWVAGKEEWRPVTEVGFDHERFTVYVWRSARAGGDTKTERSRRTLELPRRAAEALRKHHARQASQRLKAGERWQDSGLVFCSTSGRSLDPANVRRPFRLIPGRSTGIGSGR